VALWFGAVPLGQEVPAVVNDLGWSLLYWLGDDSPKASSWTIATFGAAWGVGGSQRFFGGDGFVTPIGSLFCTCCCSGQSPSAQ
jgi:hypothetical protein